MRLSLWVVSSVVHCQGLGTQVAHFIAKVMGLCKLCKSLPKPLGCKQCGWLPRQWDLCKVLCQGLGAVTGGVCCHSHGLKVKIVARAMCAPDCEVHHLNH